MCHNPPLKGGDRVGRASGSPGTLSDGIHRPDSGENHPHQTTFPLGSTIRVAKFRCAIDEAALIADDSLPYVPCVLHAELAFACLY